MSLWLDLLRRSLRPAAPAAPALLLVPLLARRPRPRPPGSPNFAGRGGLAPGRPDP